MLKELGRTLSNMWMILMPILAIDVLICFWAYHHSTHESFVNNDLIPTCLGFVILIVSIFLKFKYKIQDKNVRTNTYQTGNTPTEN